MCCFDNVCMHACVCLYVCMYVCVYPYVCMCMCVSVCMCVFSSATNRFHPLSWNSIRKCVGRLRPFRGNASSQQSRNFYASNTLRCRKASPINVNPSCHDKIVLIVRILRGDAPVSRSMLFHRTRAFVGLRKRSLVAPCCSRRISRFRQSRLSS